MTGDEVLSKVRMVLCEALDVDEEDVKEESTLQGDLGAESIDFLDIVFRLEPEFGIKIPRNELFPEVIFQGDPQYFLDDRSQWLNKEGIALVRKTLPFADLSEFERNPERSKVYDLYTVNMVVGYLEHRLSWQEKIHN